MSPVGRRNKTFQYFSLLVILDPNLIGENCFKIWSVCLSHRFHGMSEVFTKNRPVSESFLNIEKLVVVYNNRQ